MNTKDINYSLKNIPIPAQSTYLKCLVDKVENFVKRLRWKVFFYEKKLNNDSSSDSSSDDENDDPLKNTYGFKSSKTPPQNLHLKGFEDDLYQMIQDVEFDNKQNHFQQQLKRDVRESKTVKNWPYVQTKVRTCMRWK